MCVINDPLGQIYGPASSDHYSHLKFLVCDILKSGDGRSDVQTLRLKIVITTGRDWGSSSWMNIEKNLPIIFATCIVEFWRIGGNNTEKDWPD